VKRSKGLDNLSDPNATSPRISHHTSRWRKTQKVFTPQPRIPRQRLRLSQKIVSVIHFGGLNAQPQTPTRRVTDQTQIRGLETDLIKSTFDVTVRRVEPLQPRGPSDQGRMPPSVWLSFRSRWEISSWIRIRRCTVSRPSRSLDCAVLSPVLTRAVVG
jgi:hypothetical protein